MRYLPLLSFVFCLLTTPVFAQSKTRGSSPTTPASVSVTPTRSGGSPNPVANPTKAKVEPRSTTPSTGTTAGSRSTTGTADKTRSKSPNTTERGSNAPKVAAKAATIPASPTGTNGNNSAASKAPVKAKTPKASIKWMTIEEALEKSKTEKRKIIIDVYTDWCGWCKHMDSTTFVDQALVSYINEKYYPVKFNAEQATSITYKDKTYNFIKQGSRGYHELASLWLNNRLSYPTTVVLNEEQDLIQPIPGYQDAKKMDAILHYFGTDSHRTTPWEKYEKNYVKEK